MKKTLAALLTLLMCVTAIPSALAQNGPGGDDGNDDTPSTARTVVRTEQVVFTTSTADRDSTVVSSSEPPCFEYAPEAPPTSNPSDDSGDEEDTGPVTGDGTPIPDDWVPPLGGDVDLFLPQVQFSAQVGGSDETNTEDTDTTTETGSDTDTTSGTEPGERECLIYWHCRGERIDEVFSGEIADGGSGAYAEYVAWVGGIIDSVSGVLGFDFELNRTVLAETLANAGLGERPDLLQVPVFYYCRQGAGGPIAYLDATYGPELSWDANVLNEYAITTTRTVLVNELEGYLNANPATLRATPPLDQGYSIVRFPMWLWLENPTTDVTLEAVNTTSTVRISIRAQFNRIEWDMGNEIVSCTFDEMQAYEGDGAGTESACGHTFTELLDYTMGAEIFFDVTEQIARRDSDAVAWPPYPFYPHPTAPIISSVQVEGPMSVHELVSLVVSEEQG